jgi:hypothetical protein
MTTRRANPLCFRLPPDLHAAVTHAADAAGITTSEWVRDMLHRLVYGEPPGIDAGYIQGRQLGFRMVSLALRDAWNASPATIEGAMAAIQAGQPPHDEDD